MKKEKFLTVCILILSIISFNCGGKKDGDQSKQRPDTATGRSLDTSKLNQPTKTGTKQVKIYSSGIKDNLNGVHRYNQSIAYACGNNGIILATYNGGVNWVNKNTGSTKIFYDVAVPTQNTIITVGQDGEIFKSTDKGNSWHSVPSKTSRTLRTVSFYDNIHGISAGDSGIIIRTQDGGNTWLISDSVISNSLKDVYCFNENNAWVCGINGTIKKSTNGGLSWTVQTSGTTQTLNTISFFNSSTGIAAGTNGTILRTTNGGNNWSSLVSPVTKEIRGSTFIKTGQAFLVGKGTILSLSGTSVSNITTDTTYNINSIDDDNELYSGIFAGDNGITGVIYPNICSDASYVLNRDSGCNWILDIRITGTRPAPLKSVKVIVPGFDGAIQGWTQYDGPGSRQVEPRISTGTIGDRVVTVYTFADITTNEYPFRIRLNLNPIPDNTAKTGTIESYMEATDETICTVSNDTIDCP